MIAAPADCCPRVLRFVRFIREMTAFRPTGVPDRAGGEQFFVELYRDYPEITPAEQEYAQAAIRDATGT